MEYDKPLVHPFTKNIAGIRAQIWNGLQMEAIEGSNKTQDHNIDHWLTIAGEEFGEVCRHNLEADLAKTVNKGVAVERRQIPADSRTVSALNMTVREALQLAQVMLRIADRADRELSRTRLLMRDHMEAITPEPEEAK